MLKDLVLKLVGPVSILIEAYRIFNGTLLVIFVPGVCGGRACLPQQNYENGSTLYRVNCGFNLVALLSNMDSFVEHPLLLFQEVLKILKRFSKFYFVESY